MKNLFNAVTNHNRLLVDCKGGVFCCDRKSEEHRRPYKKTMSSSWLPTEYEIHHIYQYILALIHQNMIHSLKHKTLLYEQNLSNVTKYDKYNIKTNLEFQHIMLKFPLEF